MSFTSLLRTVERLTTEPIGLVHWWSRTTGRTLNRQTSHRESWRCNVVYSSMECMGF